MWALYGNPSKWDVLIGCLASRFVEGVVALIDGLRGPR
jgi:hypothetical protein